MVELGCSSIAAVLKNQFDQALADVSLVAANALQGTTDVITGLCVALALDQRRQLHDRIIRDRPRILAGLNRPLLAAYRLPRQAGMGRIATVLAISAVRQQHQSTPRLAFFTPAQHFTHDAG